MVEYKGGKCEICGYKTDELDAHEVWEFDVNNKTQTLIDIIGICSKCHGVKHMRNSQRLGFGENAKKHFMEVNKCSDLEFASHFTEAQMNFEEQNEILADVLSMGMVYGNELDVYDPFLKIDVEHKKLFNDIFIYMIKDIRNRLSDE